MNRVATGSHQDSKCQLNILLLGRSGVGKSTFINSFANYVNFDNIDQVNAENPLRSPIPSAFVLSDNLGSLKEFKCGEQNNTDKNESMVPDASGTSGCKTYEFDFQNLSIHLIDTPGIVDTEGIEQDETNLKSILDFISGYDKLHGICILLRPNERSDKVFKYCIMELLRQLDKSAAENIVFVFTNTRETMYRIGSTGLAIQKLLETIKEQKLDINIKFSTENYFCFDSEAYRFLVARDTMEFDDEVKQMYAQSWKKSRKEFVRMIEYVKKLTSHDVQNTLSLSRARKSIESLLKPLMEIAGNIAVNKGLCENQRMEISNCKGGIDELLSKMVIRRTKLLLDFNPFPRVFCGSSKCIQTLEIGHKTESYYSQICLEPYVPENAAEVAGQFLVTLPEMRSWDLLAAISGLSLTTITVVGAAAVGVVGVTALTHFFPGGSCSKCECSIMDHTISMYTTRSVTEESVDENVAYQIETENDAMEVKRNVLQVLQHEFENLKAENELINRAICVFSVFLKCRAITAFNDAYEDYLDYMIKKLDTPGETSTDRNKTKLRLEEQKRFYSEVKELVETAAQSANGGNSEPASPAEIEKIIQDLCNLENYGSLISKALTNTRSLYQNVRLKATVACAVAERLKDFFSNFESHFE